MYLPTPDDVRNVEDEPDVAANDPGPDDSNQRRLESDGVRSGIDEMVASRKEKEVEAGRLKLLEMMKNGGKPMRKIAKPRKARKPPPQDGRQKGTIFNYVSNINVGGKMERALGRKRKVTDVCDLMMVEQRMEMKPKASVAQDSDDGGGCPNSERDEEPDQTDVKKKTGDPKGLRKRRKVDIQKDFINV